MRQSVHIFVTFPTLNAILQFKEISISIKHCPFIVAIISDDLASVLFCFLLKINVLGIMQGIGWKCRWGQSALCKMLLIKIVFVGEFHQVRFSEELVSVPFVTSSRSSDFLRRHQHPGKWSSWPIWWHKRTKTRKNHKIQYNFVPRGLHISNRHKGP